MANTLGKFRQMPLTPECFIRKLINNQNWVMAVEIFIALFLTLSLSKATAEFPIFVCHTSLDYVGAFRKMIWINYKCDFEVY